jgi:hypothetical protein
MVDIENELYSIVKAEILKEFPTANVLTVPERTIAKFPTVSINEVDNSTHLQSVDSDGEQHSDVMYEFNIYSNAVGKKGQCKKIAKIIDTTITSLGFTRLLLQPITNFEDITIYRMVGRYRGYVSEDKKVFKR